MQVSATFGDNINSIWWTSAVSIIWDLLHIFADIVRARYFEFGMWVQCEKSVYSMNYRGLINFFLHVRKKQFNVVISNKWVRTVRNFINIIIFIQKILFCFHTSSQPIFINIVSIYTWCYAIYVILGIQKIYGRHWPSSTSNKFLKHLISPTTRRTDWSGQL